MRWWPAGLALGLTACALTPATYCDAVGEATCERLFTCTTGEAERATLLAVYPDLAACTKTQQERSRCATLTDSTICGTRRWNPARAAVCLDEVRTLACDQVATYVPSCPPPCE